MTQQQPDPIRGDVKQVCFPLLDADLAALEQQARKHGLPCAIFLQWLIGQYLRSPLVRHRLHAVEDEQSAWRETLHGKVS